MTSRLRRCVAVVSLALLTPGCASKPSPSDGPSATPNVPLETAARGVVVERIDVLARVGPPSGSTAKLAFAQAGTLQSIDVRLGEAIRTGTALAEIDRAALAAPLQQARADADVAGANYGDGSVPIAAQRGARAKLAAAQARLQTLESGRPSSSDGRTEAAAVARQAALKVGGDETAIARANALFAAGVVARKDVEAARQQLESDRADRIAANAKVDAATSDYVAALRQARVEVDAARSDVRSAIAQSGVLLGTLRSAQARVDAARVAYRNGELDAPRDGVVVAIFKHTGEAVDPSTPVVEIGPRAGSEVTLDVSAQAASRIAVGDAVTYTFDGLAATPSHGHVVSVVPVVDRATQTATVIADGAPPGAIEGDALSASIIVGRASGVIVPSTAIVEDPQTGATVVFVRVDGRAKGTSPFAMRPVRLGADDGARTIVVAGLKTGERYAATGGYKLLAAGGG